ncbi:DNA excision repair protein ERCC-6-like [Hydractinia symbiolongicarpus]|uniref:DNA excision repair protein ERCC-6-like n=1 Tax=Hydractinia symbiolongicarpus TaxID=13093 RepID=UPI00254FB9A2|nr:DNA excision repair protein ERCC-6-like [Hydractinia symbiolongicarpus]
MNKEKIQQLVAKAKEAARNGELLESLKLFQEAYAMHPSEKLQTRIKKLQEFIDNMESESDEEDENTDMIDIGHQFYLHHSIANKLYDYQRNGVLWFWKLFKKKQGGILGDDMGLGKTIQVIAFLAGMYDADLIKHVIIVAPLAILVNWEKEFKKWAGGIRVKPFHGNNKKQRLNNLHKIQRTEGVLITTYGMVVSNIDSLSVDENGDPFRWDYLILDEGHKIKNATKTSKCVRSIPSKLHYILTGTPVQNNLSELWSLFDFTQQGRLLGTKKTFDTEFQRPIVRAREKDATGYEQEVGNKIAESLRLLIQPYFLRRTKAEVFSNTNNDNSNKENGANQQDGKSNNDENSSTMQSKSIPELKAKKNDLIIWVYLSDLQLKLYQGFVRSERVKQALMTTSRNPLAELNLLKKISDHPRLQSTLSKFLTSSEEHETRLACGIEIDDADVDTESTIEEPAHAPPVEKLIEDSGKMVFLVYLMKNLKDENHRTVIFSQSRKMLDIIQKVLLSFDHKILRVDGTISNPMDREKIIQKFQHDFSYNVMLMTTQVGSVGLTLTGADRLVIFDPSWNPGTDAQAVDRVYRLGQTKNVIIYRLITCGSVEEKIYRKQIFKNALMKQTTGASNNPYRYFTNHELRELFVLDDPRESTTQQQLKQMHKHQSENDESFLKHLKYLENKKCIYGVSHHDQLFTQEAVDDKNDEFDDEIIQAQVLLANQRLTQERNCDGTFSRTKKQQKSSSDRSETSASSNTSSLHKTTNSAHHQSCTEVSSDLSNEEVHQSKSNDATVDCSTRSVLSQSESREGSDKLADELNILKISDNASSSTNVENISEESAVVPEIEKKSTANSSVQSISCDIVSNDHKNSNLFNASCFDAEESDCESNNNHSENNVNNLNSTTNTYEREIRTGFNASGKLDKDNKNQNESICEVADTACSPLKNHNITPKVVRDLGKLYRTPPVSPFYSSIDPHGKVSNEGDRIDERSSSTPVLNLLYSRSNDVSFKRTGGVEKAEKDGDLKSELSEDERDTSDFYDQPSVENRDEVDNFPDTFGESYIEEDAGKDDMNYDAVVEYEKIDSVTQRLNKSNDIDGQVSSCEFEADEHQKVSSRKDLSNNDGCSGVSSPLIYSPRNGNIASTHHQTSDRTAKCESLYEANDVACSPIPSINNLENVLSDQDKKDFNVETSSYEAMDMACSPMPSNNDLKNVHSDQEEKDVNVDTSSYDMACSPIRYDNSLKSVPFYRREKDLSLDVTKEDNLVCKGKDNSDNQDILVEKEMENVSEDVAKTENVGSLHLLYDEMPESGNMVDVNKPYKYVVEEESITEQPTKSTSDLKVDDNPEVHTEDETMGSTFDFELFKIKNASKDTDNTPYDPDRSAETQPLESESQELYSNDKPVVLPIDRKTMYKHPINNSVDSCQLADTIPIERDAEFYQNYQKGTKKDNEAHTIDVNQPSDADSVQESQRMFSSVESSFDFFRHEKHMNKENDTVNEKNRSVTGESYRKEFLHEGNVTNQTSTHSVVLSDDETDVSSSDEKDSDLVTSVNDAIADKEVLPGRDDDSHRLEKVRMLKSLFEENMGKINLDEHVLIKIGELLKELDI